jgi:MEMO1 family protein
MAEPASQRTKIRPAAVAGSFYAGHPQRLRATVADLLTAAPASAGASPKALIAPHAGYIYSGGVAAAAFATLRGSAAITRVVLIGPAHYVAGGC